MYKNIIKKLEPKSIAILGFGLEGKSTYHFIRRHLKEKSITIIDKNDIRNEELLKDNYLDFVIGEHYLDDLEKYDVIIKTPGISLKEIDTSKIENKITSQIELLLEEYHEQVIGITGTKGKSTTTSLLYETLKAVGKDVYLLGNIGVPVLDEIEHYHKDSILVVEMSSHQLEYIKVSPHIGVILNLFEDHLDHAGSVERYHNIKMHMFKYQTKDDIAIYCKDNEVLYQKVLEGDYQTHLYPVTLNESTDANTISIHGDYVSYQNELLYPVHGKRNLVGEHNLQNIMVILLILKLHDVDISKVIDTINSFQPLEHRLECVGTFDGVTYYNDTIATIPAATMNGIEALKKVNTLIFGGMDRGISYNDFITYLNHSKVEHLICMPRTGHHIGKELVARKTEK
ncbi:MAG: UDP-N-acetylmuramoyl-L-alanine--D-glutamate ligase, partial [Firmicutes bacterium]|nr:UDP-N-acetylmuramoyl-L-alanine--D-glutamate ligase [Bacillota bacterium]